MLSANWARVVLAIALVLFWGGVIVWIRMGRSPAAIAGFLLALYLIAPLYAMLAPVRERDPAMSAASGGLVGVIVLVLFVAALLVAGVAFHIRALVWTAFVLTVLPAVAVTIGAIFYAVSLLAKQR